MKKVKPSLKSGGFYVYRERGKYGKKNKNKAYFSDNGFELYLDDYRDFLNSLPESSAKDGSDLIRCYETRSTD